MRISKYELITEVAMLCDELEAAKRELSELRRIFEIRDKNSDSEGLSATDLMCLNAGRKKIFKDGTYICHKVKANRNDETGAIEVTPFEKFRQEVFYCCPDSMSKREFFDYFDGEFRAMYEEDKKEAIESLKEEEKEGEDA